MTHIPEVLEVMEGGGGDNSTSKKSERVLRVPYILAVFVSVIFLLSLLVSTFLFYKYIACCDDAQQTKVIGDNDDTTEIDLWAFNSFYGNKPAKDVRLPRAVFPDSYQLKIIPFIWEGNFEHE